VNPASLLGIALSVQSAWAAVYFGVLAAREGGIPHDFCLHISIGYTVATFVFAALGKLSWGL
jgi:hypothetical protein